MLTDLLMRLRAVTVQAQHEDELPDFLAERIFALAERVSSHQNVYPELERLIDQVSLYDTYGQTGYIGMGVNNTILEGTIRRLEEMLKDV